MREVSKVLFIVFCGCFFAGMLPAKAQTSDQNIIRLIVGYPAGGGLDSATRIFAEHLQEVTKKNVIVENKPGAASLIAAQYVASATPDGSVFLVAPMTVTAVHPFIFKNLTFDPNQDLVPVVELGMFRYGLAVNNKIPVKNVEEFISWARQQSGQVNFATLGTGSFAQLLGLLFNDAAGTSMVEIPYKGSAPGLLDLQGGNVQATFDTNASLVPYYKANAIRMLAITGKERSPLMPDVPTFAELPLNLGYIKEAEFWYGIFAPKGTPKAIVDALNKNVTAAVGSPKLIERFSVLDMAPRPHSPEAFAAIVAADTKRWSEIIRSYGSKIESK